MFNKPASESTSMLAPVLTKLAALRPVPAEISTNAGVVTLPNVMNAPASSTTLPAVVLKVLTFKSPAVAFSLTPVAPVTVCDCKPPRAVMAKMLAVLLTRLEAKIPVPAVTDRAPLAVADCKVMA